MKKNTLVILMTLTFVLPCRTQQAENKNKIEGDVYRNEKMGVQVRLPDGEWYLEERIAEPATIVILTNSTWASFQFRITMISTDMQVLTAEDLKSLLPMRYGSNYQILEMGEGNLGDVKTSTLYYEFTKDKTVSRAFVHVFVIGENSYQVYALSDKENWEDKQKVFLKMFDGVSFVGGKDGKPEDLPVGFAKPMQTITTKSSKASHTLHSGGEKIMLYSAAPTDQERRHENNMHGVYLLTRIIRMKISTRSAGLIVRAAAFSGKYLGLKLAHI